MSPKEWPGKKQVAVFLSVDVVERAKNIVYWTPGVTLAGLIGEGLEKAVEQREGANGGPYKQRPHDLPVGRPLVRENRKKKRAAVQSDSRGLRRPTLKDRTRNSRKRG